jgi:hypothetical protein
MLAENTRPLHQRHSTTEYLHLCSSPNPNPHKAIEKPEDTYVQSEVCYRKETLKLTPGKEIIFIILSE